MAIWQLDFHIIPSDWLYSDITNGDECLWINKKISKSDIVAPEFLEMFKSNDDEIQYGDYDKTCITFSFMNNYLCEIFCRIDLRNISVNLLAEIISYFKQMGGDILYDNAVYELSAETLRKIILQSNAYKFCVSPLDYLNDLIEQDS